MAIVQNTFRITAGKIKPGLLNFVRTTNATRINNIGLIETVSANKIRYDYSPSAVGSPRGWLLEEASTNMCKQSEDFSDAVWLTSTDAYTNNTSVSGAGGIIAPDGTTNADTIEATAGVEGIVAVKQTGLSFSATTYTASVFAKKRDLNYLEISDSDDTTGMTFSQIFNLATGTTGASSGSVTSKITSYTNSWYRCEVSFTITAGTANGTIYIKTSSADTTSTMFTPTVGQGTYIWGAQIEETGYATSYIKTLADTVQRSLDQAYLSNTQDRWNGTEGFSMQFEGTPLNAGSTNKVRPLYHYQDTSNDNHITHLSDGTMSVKSGNVQQLAGDPFATNFEAIRENVTRSAISIKPNRFHAAQNGSLSTAALPDTSINMPVNNGSDYTVKFFHGTGYPDGGSGWLQSFSIYPTAFSNAALEGLSARTNNDVQEQVRLAMHIGDGTIGTVKLTDEGVTSDKLGAAAVTAPKMAPDSVVEACIVDGAVTNSKIANNAITTDKIAFEVIVANDLNANSVTVAKIADNAVIKNKIADNSVDIAKLDVTDSGSAGDVLKTNGAGVLGFTDPSAQAVGGDLSGTVGNAQIAANKVGVSELNLSEGTNGQVLTTNGAGTLSFTTISTDASGQAVGGVFAGTVGAITVPDYAITLNMMDDDAINEAKIINLAVTEQKIANNAVTSDKIATGAVGATEIAGDTIASAHIVNGTIIDDDLASNSVTEIKILNDSVTADKLADHATLDANRAVGTNHIKDANITNGKLATNSVANGNIINGAVTELKIANNAVTDTQLNTGAVTNSKLAPNAVTNSKIVDGQIAIAKLDTSNSPAAGQILSHTGTGQFTWVDDTDTTIGDAALTGDVTGTLGANTVNWNLIPNNTITSAMIGVDVIVAEDVANNAITIAQLNANSVDLSKLVVTGGAATAGQILSHDGNGDFTWVDDTDTTIGDAAVGGMVSGTISNVSIAAGVVTPTMLSATGTANNTTFLRGDGVWATPVTVEVDPTAVTMAIALG